MSNITCSIWNELAEKPAIFKQQARVEIEKAINGNFAELKVRRFYTTQDESLVDALVEAAYKQVITDKGKGTGCIYQTQQQDQTSGQLEEFIAQLNISLGHLFEFSLCDQRDYKYCFTITTL